MIESYLGLQQVFARHETFHPRFGWLRKAVLAANEDDGLFLAPDAPTRLGVGKNMVRSIRYWGRAFTVLRDVRQPGRRLPVVRPTNLGATLFEDDGWDPYLEDPATLWLLHWRLMRPPCHAPVWSLVFNKLSALEFDEDALCQFVVDIGAGHFPDLNASSVRKDVSCLLRMYAQRPKARETLEDALDCPFRELGLVRSTADGDGYRFGVGSASSLPDALIVHAALDYLAFSSSTGRTATVPRLAAAPGGPGQVFKLDESALRKALERYAAQPGARVRLSAPAGVVQLAFEGHPGQLARSILEDLFLDRSGSQRRLGGGAEDHELALLDEQLGEAADPLDRLRMANRRVKAAMTEQGS